MMEYVDYALILLLLSDMALLASSRLNLCVRVVGFQGVLAGLFPLIAAGQPFTPLALGTAALVVGLKAVLFPLLLVRTMKAVNVRQEVEPYIGYGASVVIGMTALAAAYYVCTRLPFPSWTLDVPIAPSIALFTIFTGLFLIVSRLKAITQVIGYIAFENGIYVLGSVVLFEQSLVVELGILLDLLVVVFIMGIAISHISSEFDHIDTDHLDV